MEGDGRLCDAEVGLWRDIEVAMIARMMYKRGKKGRKEDC